jgi:predicted AAA+ superfamily ATPase
MIRQTIHDELLKRLREKRRFMQVLAGPRQVGTTTVARQVK